MDGGVVEEKEVITLIDHVMRDPMLFGDFRNATNESEPRFYEDLLDFDAIFHLFTEVGCDSEEQFFIEFSFFLK